jgi:hypothetical protein
MPDVTTRSSNNNMASQTARAALSFASSVADARVPSSSMIVDSDDDDDIVDGDAIDEIVPSHISNRRSSEISHAGAAHGATPDRSLMDDDTEEEQEVVDNRPITFLDKELFRSEWIGKNKPCSLNEYIRHERARIKVFEDSKPGPSQT